MLEDERMRQSIFESDTLHHAVSYDDAVNDAATIIAIKSAIGAANNIPSIPKNRGKISISGMKHTISRIMAETMACAGFPTA